MQHMCQQICTQVIQEPSSSLLLLHPFPIAHSCTVHADTSQVNALAELPARLDTSPQCNSATQAPPSDYLVIDDSD